MANNDLLINAAYVGFIAGALDGRAPSSEDAASYLNLTQAAYAFATRVDGDIAEDATISDVGGAALPPTTALIQTAQLAKTDLLKSICASLVAGRYPTSAVAADYDDLSDVAVAIYTEALLLLEA